MTIDNVHAFRSPNSGKTHIVLLSDKSGCKVLRSYTNKPKQRAADLLKQIKSGEYVKGSLAFGDNEPIVSIIVNPYYVK
jgi:hypothetical protein